MLLKQMWNRRDLASPLSEILGVGIVVSVLLYGGALVIEGEGGITPSQFISFILIYTQVLAPIKTLANTATVIQRGIASGERIFKLLEAENPIVEAENPKSISEIKEGIEFKNVSFSYADRVVLKNISFSIPKGKMVALVGASGSGKSTLSDLLPRFMDVQEGSVCIDGVDIREYKLADLRGLMGIVTQESILFNDTIYSNIVFNNAHATKEEVMEAAKVAHCEEFVNLLPDKYETTIGDRGNRLSGGQRQRLNIARAVLKNPPVLVLDEATSALDNESERLVQDALMKLMVNRTSLVIAHRLSTIQGADEIIVLDQGEIVERGTHDFLMQKQGYYYRMHQK
jgi:subfamily B ATP-binding cassette protein MsbA